MFWHLLGIANPTGSWSISSCYQSAVRKFQEVHMDWHRSQRVPRRPGHHAVGASATTIRTPMYGEKKADHEIVHTDHQDFRDDGTSIIVAINDDTANSAGDYVKGGLISGSINGFRSAWRRITKTATRSSGFHSSARTPSDSWAKD